MSLNKAKLLILCTVFQQVTLFRDKSINLSESEFAELAKCKWVKLIQLSCKSLNPANPDFQTVKFRNDTAFLTNNAVLPVENHRENQYHQWLRGHHLVHVHRHQIDFAHLQQNSIGLG